MSNSVERYTVRSAARIGYVFAVPFVLAISLYLTIFLGLNSQQGSKWLAEGISTAMEGTLEMTYLRVGPDLLTLDLFDATLRDVFGRPAVEVRRIGCTFLPSQLVRNRLQFDRCSAEDGRLLIMSYDNGAIGLMTAFEGEFRPKSRERERIRMAFYDIELTNIDVLIQLRDMMLRFDSVTATGGSVDFSDAITDISADFTAEGGRIVLTERSLMATDRRGTWEELQWDIDRRNRPWVASHATLPAPTDDGRGILDVPLTEVAIERFRWQGEPFAFTRLHAESPVVSVDASGTLRLVPERPKVAQRERAFVSYEGRAALGVPPSSPVFDFVLPGMIDVLASPRSGPSSIAPLQFEGYGTVRFFQGATQLSLTDIGMLGWPIDRFDGDLSWDNGLITLADDARLEAWGGAVTGGGQLGAHDGRWRLDVCADALSLASIARPWVTEPGPSFQASLSSTPAVCTPGTPAAVQLEGDLTRKGLGVSFARETLADAVIPEPLIMGTFDGLTLGWRRAPSWLPAGELRADIAATLTTRGVLELETSERSGVRLTSGGDELTLTGALDLPAERLQELRVTASTPRFERWLSEFVDGDLPQDVRLNTSFVADGPWDAPRIRRLDISFDKPDDDQRFPAFSLSGDLEIIGDQLVINDGRWTSSLGSARARGSVDLLDGSVFRPLSRPNFDVNVALTDIALARLAPDSPVDATFDATFSVRGRPGELELVGTRLEAFDFRAWNEPVDYLFASAFLLSNDRIVFEDVLVVKGKGQFSAQVDIDIASRALDIRARGDDFRLDEIRLLDPLGLGLRGRVDAFATIVGTLDDPIVRGSAVARELEAMRVDIGGAAITFDTFEGGVEIAGEVAGDLDVDARLPLDGSPVTLSAAFHRVSLEERIPELADAIDRSAISGRASASIDPSSDQVIRGQLELSEVDVTLSGRQFDSAQTARLSWIASSGDDGLTHTIELDRFSIGTEGRYLVAAGGMVLRPEEDGEVRIVVQGDTDLSLLRFVPSLIVDAEGPAQVDLTIFGTLVEPGYRGSIAFERSRVAPRGLGTSVFLNPGVVQVRDRAIWADESTPLSGTVFGGDFTAHGRVGLERFVPDSIDLEIFVTNLTYRVPDELNTTLTADVRFYAGDVQEYDTWAVTGEVELVDARWYGDIDVVGDSLSFGGFGRTVDSFSLPVWRRVPAIEQMRADLRVTGRDRFRVDNRIADAEMDLEFRTDLRLTGTFGEMVLVGEMESLDPSTVTYRGRTFDLDQATLYFEGQRDPLGYPMPRLESELSSSIQPCVRGTRTTTAAGLDGSADSFDTQQDVFIVAQVDGQLPLDLTFDLESTPFYDQRDLLSLVLTGCTVDELTAGEAGGRTLEVVLRPFLDAVERNVEERLALEDVELVPTTQGTAGITIQDEISERFVWTFDAVLGSATDSEQVIRGSYRLFDWLSLEAQEQASRRDSLQLDVGFRFRVELN